MRRKLIYLISFVALLALQGNVVEAKIIVAEELLVDLSADNLPHGTVLTWPNDGTLGDFTTHGSIVVENVAGRKAVTFNGLSWLSGPLSTPGIEGVGTRSIEVWAYNPSVDMHETMVSWSHRGGPAGTNMAFTYGTHEEWGAVGHWGGGSHDMGYWGNHAPAPIPNTWWYLVYTYDGTAARVYVNGMLESIRDPVDLNTHGGNIIRVGAQADTTGAGPQDINKFSGSIAEVRVHDGVLSPEDIQNNFLGMLNKAHEPNPADGAEGVNSPLLQWAAGETASSHDVYVGIDETDVANASTSTTGIYRGRQSATSHDIGGLEWEQTYYWRIDEVEADGYTIHVGDVWRFTAATFTAHSPYPRNGDKWIDPDADLSWGPGGTAVSHDVYLGTDPTEVATGTGGTFRGNQLITACDPGLLALETTYYWRIDEIEADGITKYPGELWSFTTIGTGGGVKAEYYNNTTLSGEPVLTRTEPEINFDWGSGSPDPVISADQYSARWTGDLEVVFSEPYTFICNADDGFRLWLDDELIIDVWQDRQEPTEHRSGPMELAAGQLYSIRAEWYENSGTAVAQLYWQSPSQPRQIIPIGPLQLPLRANVPEPANGATDVKRKPTLHWKAGVEALQHDVYLGTDQIAVANADTTTIGIYRGRQSATSYGPLSLELMKTYYWRIDEVNQAHPDMLWKGNVWQFTVAREVEYALLDDMEYYGWENQPAVPGGRIWYTWKDGEGWTIPEPGWGGNGSGAVVDLEQGSGNVHTGEQSLKVDYDNDGVNVFGISGKAFYSEIEADIADLPIGPDWTAYDAVALELWFRGTTGNDATQQMWVALEDTLGASPVVLYNGNMSDITIDEWKLWRIPLKEFGGLDLARVKSISIGFGLRGNTSTRGGAGTVYFDDIRVYPCRPGGLVADLNHDCVIDLKDLAIFMDNWLSKQLAP